MNQPSADPGTTITHLPEACCAKETFTRRQICQYIILCILLILFVFWDYKVAFTSINLFICAFYGFSVAFRLLSALMAMIRHPEIRVEPDEWGEKAETDWPFYSLLVPLYHEARVVPKLIESLDALDYPKSRLEVLLLLEADDQETRNALKDIELPTCFRVIDVPEGSPNTKPRACNAGLAEARGDLLVIYDAEDRPEPDQLRKAATAFRKAPREVVCLQAKLLYWNADQNWLTRFFALEYAAWYDLFLPGLHAMGLPIPLGGTSNHFRVETLKACGGWDAYNVAEDCDLGIRLARSGCKTLILDAVTWEEANSRLWNWTRQRSRWVKGYLQTHFVHMRRPILAWRELGTKGFVGFLLSVGGLGAVLLLNPLYWAFLMAWLILRWRLLYFDFTDATMAEYTFWSKISWTFFGISVLLFLANFALILTNVLACFRRGLTRLLTYALLSPLYWVLISAAAWKGAWQLLRNPHYWEKTEHGLAEGGQE